MRSELILLARIAKSNNQLHVRRSSLVVGRWRKTKTRTTGLADDQRPTTDDSLLLLFLLLGRSFAFLFRLLLTLLDNFRFRCRRRSFAAHSFRSRHDLFLIRDNVRDWLILVSNQTNLVAFRQI